MWLRLLASEFPSKFQNGDRALASAVTFFDSGTVGQLLGRTAIESLTTNVFRWKCRRIEATPLGAIA